MLVCLCVFYSAFSFFLFFRLRLAFSHQNTYSPIQMHILCLIYLSRSLVCLVFFASIYIFLKLMLFLSRAAWQSISQTLPNEHNSTLVQCFQCRCMKYVLSICLSFSLHRNLSSNFLTYIALRWWSTDAISLCVRWRAFTIPIQFGQNEF